MDVDSKLIIHVGEIEGSYEYFKEWNREHPTYDTINSDYIMEE